MQVDDPTTTAQRVPGSAKRRILETVMRLFYLDGIHHVGVDRIIAEASVTKATFYKHYGSKDNLILKYIHTQHEQMEAYLDSVVESSASPADAIRTFVADTIAEVAARDFRGCPFLNAAAEFPDQQHLVRQVVTDHREWMTERLSKLLAGAGHPRPGDGADELLLARDGAMTGGYAGDPVAATAAFTRVAGSVLRAAASG